MFRVPSPTPPGAHESVTPHRDTDTDGKRRSLSLGSGGPYLPSKEPPTPTTKVLLPTPIPAPCTVPGLLPGLLIAPTSRLTCHLDPTVCSARGLDPTPASKTATDPVLGETKDPVYGSHVRLIVGTVVLPVHLSTAVVTVVTSPVVVAGSTGVVVEVVGLVFTTVSTAVEEEDLGHSQSHLFTLRRPPDASPHSTVSLPVPPPRPPLPLSYLPVNKTMHVGRDQAHTGAYNSETKEHENIRGNCLTSLE